MRVGDAGLGPTVGRRVDAGDTGLVELVGALFGPAAIVEGGAVRHDVRGLRATLLEEAAWALGDGGDGRLVVVNAATDPRRRARIDTDARTFRARLAGALDPPAAIPVPGIPGRTLILELRSGG